MSFEHLTAGRNLANDFNVVVEIPAMGGQVKYEVCKDTGLLKVDRFMPTSMIYPCNYGYIPRTLAEDGDPIDVLVMTPYPIQAGAVVRCRPLGVLQMTDEAGEDSKILAVPIEKCCIEFHHYQNLDDVPTLIKDRIKHFFEQYKALEPNKWVKVSGWAERLVAEREIEQGVSRFQRKIGEEKY